MTDVVGLNLDIERWFAPESTSEQGFVTGRMSPLTALMLILLSLATLVSSPSRVYRRWARLAAQGLAAVTFLIATVLAIGYWFPGLLLYDTRIIPVALFTVVGVILLCISLLFDGPDSVLFRLALSDSVFARFSRLAIPGSVTIILVGGWFSLQVASDKDSSLRVIVVTVTALLTATLVACLMGIVARHVNTVVSHAEQAVRESDKQYPHPLRRFDRRGLLCSKGWHHN